MAPNPLHLALLKLSEKIGRALRETEGQLMPYPAALELLGDLEDQLSELAHSITEMHEMKPLTNIVHLPKDYPKIPKEYGK